jgi:protein transport protein SEC24
MNSSSHYFPYPNERFPQKIPDSQPTPPIPNPQTHNPSSRIYPPQVNPNDSQIPRNPKGDFYNQNILQQTHNPANYPNQPTSQKVNTSLLPTVSLVQKSDLERFDFGNRPYFTSKYGEEPIPMTSSDTQIIDEGNSSCRFVRSTCYLLPSSSELAESCKLPIGLVFQPFSDQPSHEIPIPLVNFGQEIDPKTGNYLTRGPLRCNRCRGYINPKVSFERGGKVWRCNLCTFTNEVPEWYYCELDAAGRRLDLSSHPELQFGTIDIVASNDYILRKEIHPPRITFGIDSSRGSVQIGAFFLFIESIKSFLRVPGIENLYAFASILLFDKTITFIEVSKNSKEAKLLVLPDVSDQFAVNPTNSPLDNGIFFDLSSEHSKELVISLLDKLPQLIVETKITDSCFGAAISVSYETLKNCGGRVVLLASTLPNYGPGALKNRENVVTTEGSSDRVNPLFNPQGDFYSKIATNASANAVSFGLVLIPSSFIDIGTLSELTSSTSGFLLYYPKLRNNNNLIASGITDDLLGHLCKNFVYDSIIRLRCGPGLQEGDCYGSCGPIITNTQLDYNFPFLSSDQSFVHKVSYDDRLKDGEMAHFQLAILYTTTKGERRIRMVNFYVPISSNPSQLFKFIDFEALLAYESKMMSSKILTQPLKTICSNFITRGSQLLAAYRKLCTASVSTGQVSSVYNIS